MKKIIRPFLLILSLMIFSACGSKEPESVLPPLEQEGDHISSAGISETQTGVLLEDTLENGLHITVFSDGVLLLENADVEENLKNRSVFSDYVANIKVLRLGEGVTAVGEKAFSGFDKLEQIVFGDDVREIGYSAFSGCSAVVSIQFGEGLETIEDYAFEGCTALKDAVLSDSVISVGSYAFSGCTALQNAVFGSNIQQMGNCIFNGCTKLADFRVGSNVASSALEGCTSLVSITMDETVTEIGSRAFAGCTALRYITYSPKLERIGDYAFDSCDFTEIELPTNLTRIGQGALQMTGLRFVRIPSGVTYIGDFAFKYCEQLTDVWFTGDTPSIGGRETFETYTTIHYPEDNPTWDFAPADGERAAWNGMILYWDGHSHAWDEGTVTMELSDLADGMMRYICTECGHTYDEVIHKYIASIQNPDCTEQGYTLHTCANCGG